jgi:hypothetical protein
MAAASRCVSWVYLLVGMQAQHQRIQGQFGNNLFELEAHPGAP